MRIPPFQLERFFAKYEFSTRHLLSSSDCESWELGELLDAASEQTRSAWQQMRFEYTDSQGHPGLRDRIAGMYQSVEPANVVVAAPEEAIFILMNALLEPGDRVVVLSPAYQSLHEIPRTIGCHVENVPLHTEGITWTLDLDRLRRAVTPATRMLIVNFPHNPTGYLPSRGVFDEIVGLARHCGCWLLGDEMYRLLEYDPETRLPAMCDACEKGISLSGLSKSFGLPGLRIGWLATRDANVVQRCLGIKDYTTICSSAPAEILAMIGIDSRERLLARNRAIVARNLELARAFFTAPRFEWLDPQAGSVAFPRWTGPGTVDQFAREMLEARQVLITPARLFDWPGSHFRVGLGRAGFPAALECLRS